MQPLKIKLSRSVALAWLPAVVLALVFGSLCFPQLDAPPPNPEETQESLELHRALAYPDELPPRWLEREGAILRLFGRALPLMEDTSYVGAVELYLQHPLFVVFGRNAFALRLLPILAGLTALIASFLVCRRWFGLSTAFIASLMVATHPFVVHYTRLGRQMEEIFAAAFFWLGVYCLDRYVRSEWERIVLACGGMFLFGVGLSHKIDFLWYFAGMAVVALVFHRRIMAAWKLRVSHALLGAAAFGLGCGPILLYNLRTAGGTVRTMAQALAAPIPKGGIDNLHYGANLLVRIKQFVGGPLKGALEDPSFDEVVTEAPFAYNHLFTILFVVGLVAVPYLTLRGRLPYPRTLLLAVFALFGTIFFVSPFTVSGFFPNHLLVMLPFAQLVVAFLLAGAPTLFDRHKAAVWVSRALLAAVLAMNLFLTVHFHRDMADTIPRGSSPWMTLEYPGFDARFPAPIIPMDDRW